MKIFQKTFLYTLALLVLIAGFANGLIYTLMPGVYTRQKKEDLSVKTEQLAERLGTAKREDITVLMGSFAASAQANITVTVGKDKYALIMWQDASEPDGAVTTYVTVTSNTEAETETTAASSKTKSNSVAKVFTADGSQSGIVKTAVSGATSIPGVSYTPAETIKATRSFKMTGEQGTLTMSMTLAPVEEAVDIIVSLLPVSLILCVVLAVIFSFFYARALTRPIKAISDETLRMTRLERNARCRVKSKDEFGELAANVNGLYDNLLSTIDSLEAELKKVAAAEQAKTDFLRAASHELKTPVTAVSLIVENMQLGVGKYKNHSEWLGKCKMLMEGLSDKLRDILDASQLDGAAEACVTESIEYMCAETLDPYVTIARAKGLSVYVDRSGAFTVTAPPKLLCKALSNIFSNAVRYTEPNGTFSVYCKARSLIIENTCEPIPEDRLSRLFEPFYRPDDSRSRETGGNGLGLYITDTALRLLELDYSFEPMSSPDGMRFTINF